MIQLSGINKSYGTLQVLSDISLTIGDHEIVTIVGPSGAGKTTLLQIAGTLDRPDSGLVVYDGKEISGLRDRQLSRFRNSNIGFIFQFHQLLPEFTACENVALPALIGGMSRRKTLERSAELLDMLGMSARINHKPGELSGGERQRVAIARALINEPKVIFADEPTGSLDSKNRDDIRNVIADLRTRLGQTFVIVTHDPYMTTIADRVISMADGRIISEAAPASEITEAALSESSEPEEVLPENIDIAESENNC